MWPSFPSGCTGVWARFNVSPEGKVSPELFLAQGRGEPAGTQAPEPFLPDGIAVLNEAFTKRFGCALFRTYPESVEVFKPCHRFKALSESGLYGLAKDLVRVVVEHIDAAALQKIVALPLPKRNGAR
jgi:hypothetical protein